MELFRKKKLLTILQKTFIFDAWQSSQYACASYKYVTGYENRTLGQHEKIFASGSRLREIFFQSEPVATLKTNFSCLRSFYLMLSMTFNTIFFVFCF